MPNKHLLNLEIPDVNNPYLFQIEDKSFYAENLAVSCAELFIITPGFKVPVRLSVEKDFNVKLHACDLGIQVTKCDTQYNALPDGIYTVRYSVSPNDKTFIEYKYLRLTNAWNNYFQILASLDIECCEPEQDLIDKYKQLNLIKSYLIAAKLAVETGHDLEKGLNLYQYALKLIKKIVPKSFIKVLLPLDHTSTVPALPVLGKPAVTITGLQTNNFTINVDPVLNATTYDYYLDGILIYSGSDLTRNVVNTGIGVRTITVIAKANGYTNSLSGTTTVTTTTPSVTYNVNYGWTDVDPYNDIINSITPTLQKTLVATDILQDLVLDFHDMPPFKYVVVSTPISLTTKTYYSDSSSAFANDIIPGDHFRPSFIKNNLCYYVSYAPESFGNGLNDRVTFSTI